MSLHIQFLKRNYFVLLVLIFSYSSTLKAQENTSETTTYYFIRHAEKDRSNAENKNPNLTKLGIARAENWSVVFENVPFDFIYSTKYNRTIQTAEPTAKKQQLEIQYYSPNQLYSTDFQQQTKHKTVLIVGHSNTTPQFVNDILGEQKYPEIEDDNNSNLYILTIVGTTKNCILLKIPFEK
jgi:broad specificity phosphatase PhoE